MITMTYAYSEKADPNHVNTSRNGNKVNDITIKYKIIIFVFIYLETHYSVGRLLWISDYRIDTADRSSP